MTLYCRPPHAVLPAWQVLVISQCNVELPEAVRRMSKLERLVRAFFPRLHACPCASLYCPTWCPALPCPAWLCPARFCLACRHRNLCPAPLRCPARASALLARPAPPAPQFVTSTPVTSLAPGAYCRSLRHLCLDWDVAFESIPMLEQCGQMEVGWGWGGRGRGMWGGVSCPVAAGLSQCAPDTLRLSCCNVAAAPNCTAFTPPYPLHPPLPCECRC